MPKQRLFVFGSISQRWNHGDRILWKIIGAIHEMAGRGDGARGEQIDIGDVMKQLTKLQTSPSKNIDVGTIIGCNLFFEDEDIINCDCAFLDAMS